MNNTPRGGSGPNLPGGPGQQQRPPRRRLSVRQWWIILGAVLLFNVIYYYAALGLSGSGTGLRLDASYTTLVAQVRANNVTTAQIAGTAVSGDFKRPYKNPTDKKVYAHYSTTVPSELLITFVPMLDQHRVRISFTSQAIPFWQTLLVLVVQGLPFIFLIGLFYFGSRAARQQQQGIFGFGQSRAKLYTEERPGTTFADVAALEAAKSELLEIVDFLRDASKYHLLGARIPKGVLLTGPPGTGKTLLARAIAGEARVPFFSISSTEFVEMFVGVGASRVRDLFQRAKVAAPAIVFIDELDAIGGRRSARGPGGSGGNDEREQTLNQLLVAMDGFEPNEAVIVIGATNRPDGLDPALLRPGRFDRQVVVDLPDRRGREAILRLHTRSIPLAPDVDLASLAQGTPGMSGADLANLANEAALTAARANRTAVTRVDFDQALDRITLGSEGAPLMDEEERRLVAYHEGGHALVAMMLPNVDPVHRVTITPRGRSLGVTQFRPIDDRRNYRRDYLVNRMAVGLGGRAAEEEACDDITSGAQNDLQQVTNVARAMVTQLGMADEVGLVYWGGTGAEGLNAGLYLPWEPKEYSDETAQRIDSAVRALVDEAHDRARGLLRDHRAALNAIAAALMHEESLTGEELTAIVNAHLAPGQKPLPAPPAELTLIGESARVADPAV
jgi:cell division protease FtsH